MTRTRVLTIGLMIGFTVVTSAQPQGASSYAQLGAALRLEEVDGNCREALPIFQRLAADRGMPRDVAARALLHVGTCRSQLRLGDGRAEYEAVITRFGDQAQIAAAARARIDSFNTKLKNAPSQRLVATGADGDRFGFVTADGRWLARPDWTVGDMVLRDMNSGRLRRLLHKPGTDSGSVYRAILSPDGKTVAYVWLTNCCRESRFELRLLSLNGSNAPQLMKLAEVFSNQFPELVAWSADNKSLLVNVTGRQGQARLQWISIVNNTVKPVTSLDRRMRLHVPNRPSLSPDGRYIAYAALPETPPTAVSNEEFDGAEQHIYVMSANGSPEVAVVRGNSINESPVWAPDGRHLLFVSDRSGAFGLWSLAMRDGGATGEPVVLLKDTGRIRPVGMTRDGRYYFSKGDTGGESLDVFITTVDRDGSLNAQMRLTSTAVDQNRDPAWSPDGKSVVFARGRRQMVTTPAIETANSDTDIAISRSNSDLVFRSMESGQEVIHASGAFDPTPVWLHDNKTVLIRGNGGDVRAFDVARGQSTPLGVLAALRAVSPGANAADTSRQPAPIDNYWISRDDKVLYVAQPNRIVTFDLASKAIKELWTAPSDKTIMSTALSADGTALVAVVGSPFEYLHTLTRIATDGSGSRVLTTSAFQKSIAWSRDGRFVYFVGDHLEHTQLMRVVSDGSKAPEPAGTVLPESGQMSFSPDGSRVVFTASTRAPELWVLDNLATLLQKP